MAPWNGPNYICSVPCGSVGTAAGEVERCWEDVSHWASITLWLRPSHRSSPIIGIFTASLNLACCCTHAAVRWVGWHRHLCYVLLIFLLVQCMCSVLTRLCAAVRNKPVSSYSSSNYCKFIDEDNEVRRAAEYNCINPRSEVPKHT